MQASVLEAAQALLGPQPVRQGKQHGGRWLVPAQTPHKRRPREDAGAGRNCPAPHDCLPEVRQEGWSDCSVFHRSTLNKGEAIAPETQMEYGNKAAWVTMAVVVQIVSLDFGPVGDADVTANLTEAVQCGPVVHDSAEQPRDTVELPFLHIKVPHHPADSEVLSQVNNYNMSSSHQSAGQRSMQQPTAILELQKACYSLSQLKCKGSAIECSGISM